MADEDKDSKTEDPTGKRLSQVREEGNVAQSQEIKHFVMLMGALVAVGTMAPWIAGRLTLEVRPFLERPHAFPLGVDELQQLMARLTFDIGLLLALPVGLFVAVGVLGGLSQFGLLWAPKKLAPDFNKINPISGFKRLFSVRAIVEGIKGILKVLVVSAVVWTIMSPRLRSPEKMMAQDLLVTLQDLYDLLVVLLMAVCVVEGAIAVFDFAYQKYQFTQDQKMSKQEVKDEHKNMEGDPQVKGRIRQLRIQRSRERMMAKVPTASVVITNPTHFAVALKYDMESMSAPVLVAKGQDFIARKIREVAEENEVPIVENPPLARALHAAVEIDEEIPPDHYKAVAEVIGYVMRLKKNAL
ncbi:flagellar biosynthesis protein FlhB [Pararhodospirillum photometricum]|uniref:Flagellar biosynthetic protein FlhB n=1 Tax=Pararhodospirillum photometricum DSM 122 TaxID=1150469 RepID=H6SJ41_PARPM|nr:flagellar biosynthesis protein FlhB [Pararhodospirillum photometricum]CCG08006.1 Flagellar biosynthetic protein FlhB [Pararhodospirillum photometricum DSM 122]